MGVLASGDCLGHFRVLSKLGEGGMGVVYRARDEQLARDVAVKVLTTEHVGDPTARARLLREARSAAALNHPHICNVYEVGEDDGQAYIAMELVEGRALSDVLAAGPLSPADVTRYGTQLADALAHAHGRGIVHRDLKSANIVIDTEDRPKILDFGLAKPFRDTSLEEATRTAATLTEVGVVSGTLAYMAPEQLRGVAADARSDIWALGVVLHEMASGARPFRADTGFALSSAILNEAPAPLPSSVPVELRAVVARCLEKDPARRFQSAGEVAAALRAIEAGTTGAWVTWRYRLTRSLYTPIAIAGIVLLLAAGYLGREWLRVQLGGAPRTQTLAVLPLENLARDAEQAYLVDGLHEALIAELSGVGGLRVIQRASLKRYEGTTKTLAEIAAELGRVDSVVTGAVLRSGSRVRVTMHLVRASTEEALWDGKYERELTDVLSLQNEVTAAIAAELKVRLAPEASARLAKPARKINPSTFELIAKAKFHANKVTPEGFQKANEYLDEALRTDPQEPLAWATRAIVYSLMAHQGIPGMQEKAGLPARRAIELDPTLAEAYQALGETQAYYEWNLEAAAASYRRALELNPNLPDAHAHYAWYWQAKEPQGGRFLDEIRQAAALDPLNPLYAVWLGQMQLGLGRPDDALSQAAKALELDPQVMPAYILRMGAYSAKGLHKEAVAVGEKLAASPVGPLPLANALASAGRGDDARKIVDALQPSPPMTLGLAMVHTRLGDHRRALAYIEQSIAERNIYVPWIPAMVQLQPLKSDPRFAQIMASVKPLGM